MMGRGMITDFSGPYEFLSNFYRYPMYWEGLWVNTVEHAYQASKALDPRDRFAIAVAIGPGAAKRLGQQCTLRPDWEQVKVQVMRDLLRVKFQPGTHLFRRLLATAPHPLIEGNTWNDTEWGQCPLGVGKNYLGRLLMEIRDNGPRVEVE